MGRDHDHVQPFAAGAAEVITLKVKVGASVANGRTKAFLVTATSTGSGAPKDTVKAKVKAT